STTSTGLPTLFTCVRGPFSIARGGDQRPVRWFWRETKMLTSGSISSVPPYHAARRSPLASSASVAAWTKVVPEEGRSSPARSGGSFVRAAGGTAKEGGAAQRCARNAPTAAAPTRRTWMAMMRGRTGCEDREFAGPLQGCILHRRSMIEPARFNLLVGWTSMVAGTISGAAIGLFFHRE